MSIEITLDASRKAVNKLLLDHPSMSSDLKENAAQILILVGCYQGIHDQIKKHVVAAPSVVGKELKNQIFELNQHVNDVSNLVSTLRSDVAKSVSYSR